MTMFIRLHRGQYVDAVIPSSIGTQPPGSRGDIIYSISADVNPSKTIEITQNVQAVDPVTGQPLFNEDGTPQWQTQTITNPDGSTSEVSVTHQVPETVTLFQNPTQFTLADIQAVAESAGLTCVQVGSLDDAKQQRLAYLDAQQVEALKAGFVSSADGTSRTYPADAATLTQLEELRSIINSNTFPASGVVVYDAAGDELTLDQAQATTLLSDCQTFVLAQRGKRISLGNQVTAATTEEAANAVTW